MERTLPQTNLYTEANIRKNLQEIYTSISAWPSWKVDSMCNNENIVLHFLSGKSEEYQNNDGFCDKLFCVPLLRQRDTCIIRFFYG